MGGLQVPTHAMDTGNITAVESHTLSQVLSPAEEAK